MSWNGAMLFRPKPAKISQTPVQLYFTSLSVASLRTMSDATGTKLNTVNATGLIRSIVNTHTLSKMLFKKHLNTFENF